MHIEDALEFFEISYFGLDGNSIWKPSGLEYWSRSECNASSVWEVSMQPVGTNQRKKLIPARLKLLFRGSTGFYCREETIKLQEEGEKINKNSQRSEPNWLTDCGSSIYIWSQWDGICCRGGRVHTAVRRGEGWKGCGWRWAAWPDCDTAVEGSVSVAQEDEQKKCSSASFLILRSDDLTSGRCVR